MANRYSKKDSDQKLLLIGLDAVTWDVLMPLVEDGRAPNIARLMEEGAYGDLESLEPMMSPVVWTCIATGKRPEKHGVVNFYSTQDSLNSLRIWEILAKFGKTIGLFEWLVTSPPRPLREFIIPGWLATTPETFPRNLEFIKKIAFQGKERGNKLGAYFDLAFEGLKNGLRWSTALRALFHAVNLTLRRPAFYDVHYKTILMKTDVYCDLATHLLKKYQPDFSAIIFYATDQIPHHYWKFMDPLKFDGIPKDAIAKYGDVIRKAYEKSDELVGRILKAVPRDTTVLLLSDHGMEAVTDVKFVFRSEELIKYLDFPHKDKLRLQIVKSNIHIGINVSQDNERQRLQEELMESLRKITVVGKNESLFHVAVDEYSNVVVSVKEKDLDFENMLVSFPPDKVARFRLFIETKHLLSGKHSRKGIIVMRGRHIRKNRKLRSASILDVTPSILALMGCPIERDMDGRVIEDAFEVGFFQNTPIEYIDSYAEYPGELGRKEEPEVEDTLVEEEVDEIKKRLRELGYLE